MVNLVKSEIESRNVSQPFEKFIVCLMRLKLGVSVTDLADRFQISKTRAPDTISEMLNIFFKELPPRKKWPEQFQELVNYNQPEDSSHINSLREEIVYLREQNRAKTLIMKQLTEIKITLNPTSMVITSADAVIDKTAQNNNKQTSKKKRKEKCK